MKTYILTQKQLDTLVDIADDTFGGRDYRDGKTALLYHLQGALNRTELKLEQL